MRAALLVEPGRVLIDEVADPQVGPEDVEILVGGVGLCGSDSSVFSGRWKTPSLPWIMGHEAYGTIVAVGAHVPQARLGETVVVEPNIACLACTPCRRGLTSACENRLSVGMNRPGALAERLVIPSDYAWPAPALAPEALVCVEPLTVVGAALRRLARPLPDSALVVGAGPQGLLMALTLMRRGLSVQVHELNPRRAAFARQLGADLDISDTKSELVVDSVGSPAANEFAVAHAAVGAVILVLGLDDRPLGLTAQHLVRRQLELRGSLTYDHQVDFAATIAALSHHEMDPREIVLHEFDLAEVQAAFDQGPTAAGKTWVRLQPDGDPLQGQAKP